MIRKRCFYLALLCALPWLPKFSVGQATVNENLETAFLWVDPVNGSDSNPGTQAQPLQTIGAAYSLAVTNNHKNIGTKITLNPGTYREYTRIEYKKGDTTWPITIEAATAGTAIISGGVVKSNWKTYGENSSIYTHEWHHDWPLCSAVGGCPTAEEIVLHQEAFFVNGTPMTQVLTQAAMQPGTFYVDNGGETSYLWPPAGTDMSSATIESAERPTLMSIWEKSNIVLRGLVFQYANSCRGNAALYLYGSASNVLLDTITFQWNNAQGLGIDNPVTYFTVENSTAVHNGDSGFHAYETNFGLWQNDIASFNNWRGAQGAYYACNTGGAHYFGAHNDTISGLTTAFNLTHGVHWDTDNQNITGSGVLAASNLLDGMFVESSEGPVTFSSSAACHQNNSLSTGGLVLRNSQQVAMTGSTLLDNAPGQIVVIGQPGGIPITNWETGQTYNLVTQNFTNSTNVIQGNDGTQDVFRDTYLSGTDWTSFQSTLSSASNTWWNPDLTAVFDVPSPKANTLDDFPTWQALTYQDYQSAFSAPSGNPASSCTLTPDYPDFWLTVDNNALNLNSARQAVFNFTQTALNFTGTVNFTLDGIAEVNGVSATLSNPSLNTSGNSVLTVTAATSVPSGTYPVTVLGTSGDTTHTVTVSVSVQPSSVMLAPASLDFGSQAVGTTSGGQAVTLTNIGSGTLAINGIGSSGDFSQSSTCGGSLHAGASCVITVTFTPSLTGPRTGTITVTDGDPTSPQMVALSGTGSTSSVTLSPASLEFGTQAVGTPSAPLAGTLTNTGTTALVISSVAISGANAAEYSQTNTCGNSLAAGASCNVSVVFTPAGSGMRTATLTVTDNASTSTQTMSLTGTGGGAAVSFSPGSLAFGTQPLQTTSTPQNLVLTNSGTAALTVNSITLTGANAGDFSQVNGCPSSIAPGWSCTITVTFTPSQVGTRTASLTVTDNAGGSPQSVSLSGVGAAPIATLAPKLVDFGNQSVGQISAVQFVTLTNTGGATLNLSSISLTGADAGDFTATNNCASALAPRASCTLTVTFTPGAGGPRGAVVKVADNAPIPTQGVILTGVGVLRPLAVVAPSSLAFGGQLVGTPSATRSLTFTNTGTLALKLQGIQVVGGDPNDFVQTNNCQSSIPGNASCIVSVTFTPTGTGPRMALLQIREFGAGMQSAVLSGSGVKPDQDAAALNHPAEAPTLGRNPSAELSPLSNARVAKSNPSQPATSTSSRLGAHPSPSPTAVHPAASPTAQHRASTHGRAQQAHSRRPARASRVKRQKTAGRRSPNSQQKSKKTRSTHASATSKHRSKGLHHSAVRAGHSKRRQPAHRPH
jgi:hypothetical protein